MMTRTPLIHKVGNAFDDRNAFLQVTLGMIAVLRRFKAVVRLYGVCTLAVEAPPDVGTPADDPEFLYFLLGMCSLSQQAMHYVSLPRAQRQEWGAEAVPPLAASADAAVTLRQLLE
jgi:hypothetical protein